MKKAVLTHSLGPPAARRHAGDRPLRPPRQERNRRRGAHSGPLRKRARTTPARSELIARVRAEIAADTYVTEEKTRIAVDRLMAEVRADARTRSSGHHGPALPTRC